MKRLLPIALLAFLLLPSCGSGASDDTGGALDSMFGSGSSDDDSGITAEEMPYSEGPAEIPSDLVPNE